jgi:molecular chaperone DnaK (HSP70)
MLAAATQDMIDRTSEIVERLLAAAGPGVAIDDVLLVGGSSRLPAVAVALQQRFGRIPRLQDPELAVALGAAIRANRLGNAPTSSAMSATDKQAVAVLPRAVGILVRDSYDPAGLREFVQHMVRSNTPLPAEVTKPFATILDNQASVRIQVYEQAGAVASEELEHNRRVLDGEFVGLPDLPAGSRVEVTLTVGLDGRLSVTARDPKKNTDLSLEAYVDGVVDGAAAERLSASISATVIKQ